MGKEKGWSISEMTDQELIIMETDDGKDYTFFCFCTHQNFSITKNIKKDIKAGKKIPGGPSRLARIHVP